MVNTWIWTSNTSTASDTLTYPGEWYEWNGTTTTATNTITQYNYWPADVETWRDQQVAGGTPEQRQRTRELEHETRRRREKAREVAQELLLENLTEEQKHMLKHSQCFHVIGADGHRYEIDTRKQWHNVFRLNPKGEREEEFCIYQPGTPLGDNHLMQKLIVEADVALLNRVANKRRLLA